MKKLAGFLAACLLVLIGSQSPIIAQTFTNPSYCPREFPSLSPLLEITVNGTQISLEPFCYRELGDGRIEIDPIWIKANIIELDVGMGLPLPPGGQVYKIRVHTEAAPAFRKAFELIKQKRLESFIKTFDGTFVPRHINWNPTKPLSYHSWGIAIDLNAQENPLGGPASKENIKLWEEAFKPAGFKWLGPDYDPMHFELPVTIVSSSPALPPPPTPHISGVSPDQPSAQPSRQWLTVLGSGFVPESQVILSIGGSFHLIPPDRTRFVSSTQIDVYVGLTEPGTWTIQVVNPGGRYSNTFSFQVIPTVGQPPFGARPAPYQCSQPSHYISMREAANYALAAGFRGEAAAVIVAIAWAESGGNRYACNYNAGDDSWDRGILQINDRWHREITDDQAFDPALAFQAAYIISGGGTRFTEWCAYWRDCRKREGEGQGSYLRYLDAARQAIQEEITTPPGDSDQDGIPDSQDRCPYEAGPSSNGGCPPAPVTDSDNDGVPDGQDACPYEPGPSWNNGCPEVPRPTNQPPIARFIFSPANPSIDQPVRFDASSSFDPDPGDYITEYRWDFNDDRIFDADGPIAYHTFSFSASYQVTLMVVDSRGAASFQHQVISVSGSTPPPPDTGPPPPPPLPPVADSDNDGIPDSQDRCPYQAGPGWNDGCPVPPSSPPPPPPLEDDSDHDGIPDSQDRCPYQAGPSWNGGCPVTPPPPSSPPPSPSLSSLVIVPKSSSLHCTRIGKNAQLKFRATNTGSTPVTITGVTENSPNFSITGFKAQTIKPGKSKTISVKVQCSAVGVFPPPFGVTFTTSDGKSVGPAGYEISVTPKSVEQFSVNRVDVAVEGGQVRFFTWGAGIESIGVQVWDLTGKLIFSKEESGSVLAFNDKTLANGVYLYVVRVRGFDGQEYVSEVRKLVILR
jgi:hypothetical protein